MGERIFEAAAGRRAAELRLSCSLILYAISVFIAIASACCLLFVAGRLTLAYTKQLAYDGDNLSTILALDLFLAPYLLFLLFIYIFAISLILLLYRMRRNGSLTSWLLYQCSGRRAALSGLLLSIFFSALLRLFPYDISQNLQRYLSLELQRQEQIKYSALLEPGSFYYYSNWVIYLPEISSNEDKRGYYARVYRLKGNQVVFAGNGYLQQMANGGIKLEEAQGYRLNHSGRVTGRITLSNSDIFQPQWRDKQELQKILASWKIGAASPDLPFTNRGQRSDYQYPQKLQLVRQLQKYALRLSPLLMLCYLLLFLLCLRKSYRADIERWLFPLLAAWFFILIAAPFLVRIGYEKSISFNWFYFIAFSGAIILLLTRYHNGIRAFPLSINRLLRKDSD